MPSFPVRGMALGLTLLSALAFARDFRGIRPGVSTRDDVLSTLGEPNKRVREREGSTGEILVYVGGRTIEGASQVQVKIDASTLKVKQVIVLPSALLQRPEIESTYGVQCGPQTTTGCYVRKVSPGGVVYFHYAQEGLAVFFRGQTEEVASFIHLPTKGSTENANTSHLAGSQSGAQGENPEQRGGDPRGIVADGDGSEPMQGIPGFGETAGGEPETDLLLSTAPEDPLQIGGQLFVQGSVQLAQLNRPQAPCCASRPWGPEAELPFLGDVYFDGRPSERVRAMSRVRLLYDPLIQPQIQPDGTRTSASLELLLDQLWLNFDWNQNVYFTVGRQHVHWGTSKFWNHTDFLAPVVRDPVAIVDPRVGSDLLKIHVPWTAARANFYLIGLVDQLGPPSQPLRPGAAARAEIAFWSAELGLTAVVQQGMTPRYGGDFSMGLGPIDVYGDVSLRRRSDANLWALASSPHPSRGYAGRFEAIQPPDGLWAFSGGALLPIRLGDHTSELNVGLEGFYQPWGYDDPQFIPWLMLQGDYDPLYFSPYYAMAYASYSTSQAFTSTTYNARFIADVLSRSYLARVDADVKLATLMSVNLFLEVPLGRSGGTFRPVVDLPEEDLGNGVGHPSQQASPSLFRLGLGMRTSF